MPADVPSEETNDDEKSKGDKPAILVDSVSLDFVALIAALKEEGLASRAEERREDSAKRFREWITIILLLATVIAVGWQVNEMIKVYGPIKDQAEAQQRAADAAKAQSVAANKQTENTGKALEQGQRAWVGPGSATIDAAPTVGKPIIASITYQNTGREPARDFIYNANPIAVSASDDADGKLAAQISQYMKRCFATPSRENAGVVYPSTGFGGSTLSITYKGNLVDQAMVDSKKLLIIQGCFAYRTFEKVHHSAFCYFWRSDTSKAPNLNICANGNNAD